MVWLIALLAPLMALIPVVLVGQAAFCREITGGLSGNMVRKVNQSSMPAGFLPDVEATAPAAAACASRCPWRIAWPARAGSVPFYGRGADLP
jgi:hypothetical protein